MPESIKARKTRRKREALRGAALFILLQAAYVAVLLFLCLIPDLPRWLVCLFVILAALCTIPIPVSLVVLKQRFKEIEGGELDAAGQY